MAVVRITKSGGEMRILVTGGAGYIGSHTCLELLAPGMRSSSSIT